MAPGPLPEYHLRKKGPLPALPDELVQEILLRIPPDDPASLLRASLVCKSWSEAVSQRWFRRSFHDLHPSPTVLGGRTEEFLVWEPIRGAQQRVAVPVAFQFGHTTAAVFCAADGCNHHECHGSPFRVVFVSSIYDKDADDDPFTTSVCVYSSEAAAWGEPTLMHHEFIVDFTYYSSVLVGRSFLYFMTCGGFILEYDLARHGLTWFDTPDSRYSKGWPTCSLMLAEEGGLGLVEELDPHLQLWSWEVTDAQWVPGRIIYLESFSLNGAPVSASCPAHVLGFAEGANTIFVTMAAGLFAVQVQSGKATRVCDDHGYGKLIPIVGLYTPMPRGEHIRKLSASSGQLSINGNFPEGG
uniref:Uncharacterized protein n=1 Tax=Aegilops tauschii TaxID=37682 RepID=M8CVD3_AEGTA